MTTYEQKRDQPDPQAVDDELRKKIGFFTSKLQERTVANHPPVNIDDKDELELERSIEGIMQLIISHKQQWQLESNILLLQKLWGDIDGNVCLSDDTGQDYRTSEELIEDLKFRLANLTNIGGQKDD